MKVADIPVADHSGPSPGTIPHPMFMERWSPRAFSGEAVSESQVRTLVEAARWAPSCFNAQPWRLAFVLRDSAGWQGFDQSMARDVLKVPEIYDLPAIIAVGYPGDSESLPVDYEKRESPSSRKPLEEILFSQNFTELKS